MLGILRPSIHPVGDMHGICFQFPVVGHLGMELDMEDWGARPTPSPMACVHAGAHRSDDDEALPGHAEP